MFNLSINELKGKCYIVALLFFILCPKSYSADTYYLSIGYQTESNQNYTNFTTIFNNPTCCNEFKNGPGNAISFVMGIGMRFENSAIELNFGTLKGKYNFENKSYTLVSKDGIEKQAAFSYFFDLETEGYLIGASYQHNIGKNFKLGAGLYYNLIELFSYKQFEKITDNDNLIFKETQNRIRNSYSGERINNTFGYASLETFMQYELNLNKSKSIQLCPTVGANYQFPQKIDLKWNTLGLFAKLELRAYLN